jgi:dynein heavy chain, axonemal
MVYVQPSLLGWRPLVESWMETLPNTYTDRHKETIFAMCDWLLHPALRLVTKYLKQPVVLQEQVLVTSLLRLCKSELLPIFSPDLESPPTMRPSDMEAAVQNGFLFALVWSLGASVEETGRVDFDKQLRLYLDQKCALASWQACKTWAVPAT